MWENGSAPNERRYVMEHRLVMEQNLGRRLTRDETVHHKNGVRDDNRLENLELWARKHSDGQRVADLIECYTDFLRTYAPARLAEAYRHATPT